jgi:hypothetical protein
VTALFFLAANLPAEQLQRATLGAERQIFFRGKQTQRRELSTCGAKNPLVCQIKFRPARAPKPECLKRVAFEDQISSV